jgi:hypothetical protein
MKGTDEGVMRIVAVAMLAAVLSGCGGGASDAGAVSSAGTAASTSPPPAPLPAPSTGAVTLSWTAPTQNVDGSALTNLVGFDIRYGNSEGTMTQEIKVDTVGILTYVISDLALGTWYFEVNSVNSLGVESSPSGVVSTTIG